MKLFVVLCLIAAAVAAPASPDVQILRFDNDNIGVGGFNYAFELSDGTKHESRGQLKNEGKDDESLAITGSYAWVGPDGVTYIIKYTADENGYQPEIEQGPGGAVPPGVVASLLG